MQPTSLSLSRIIRAPREKVFAAWTKPSLLTKWWGPGHVTCTEAHVDLREGGEYRLANLEADGSIVWISGRFQRVRAPEELVYTWRVGTLAGPPTLVTVRFAPHADGTEILITHERFSAAAIRDMHLKGWSGCLDKLQALFEH
jgi:uncharacterized protein YndB with AHSA1/START domain